MGRFKGEIGLLLTTMVWGTGFIVCDVLLKTMSPLTLIACRFLIAAVVTGAACLIVNRRAGRRLNKRDVCRGMLLGVPLYVAFVLQITGLKYSTPSKNAFLMTMHVIIVPFIAFVLARKKADMYSVIGAAAAFTGAGVLSFNADFSVNIGDAMTAVSAFLYALHIFLLSEMTKKTDTLSLTASQMTSCTVLGVLTVLATRAEVGVINTETVLLNFYLGLICTALCFFLQTYFQKYTTETRAAIIFTTEGVFSSIYSVILSIEVFTLKLVTGGVLILFGAMMSLIKPRGKGTDRGAGSERRRT